MTAGTTPSFSRARRAVTALLVVALAAGPAFAHAHLDSSTPDAGAVVSDSVTVVELRFSEGLEVAFSTFKAYRLDAEVDLTADNAAARLNALAAVVVSRHSGTAEDGDGKIDAVVENLDGDKSVVTLTFAEPLAPGHYVVMWRVLSVDTHVVDGHIVFSVAE